jgi:molybdate transport system ATP-binding protein
VIEIKVRRTLGSVTIDADIRASGRALGLVGPSGGGKTTILNMIAGLETPDKGRIAIGDAVLFDTDRGIDLPPRARRIGYVFQEPRLFPHYSVAGNLRYGAGSNASHPALVEFDEVVGWLGIGRLLDRKPAKLSGGEKQRVAIGRALLSRPRALLLDEPLSALDDARREEILALVESLRDKLQIPMVLVSHRLDEIERIAVESARVEPGHKATLLK